MDIEKKYELVPSDREGLFRIKALKNFNDVKKGDIGGYVECEKNLSQYGDCWIYGLGKALHGAHDFFLHVSRSFNQIGRASCRERV